MINKRVITIITAVALSVLYALPNLYPDSPTIIFSKDMQGSKLTSLLENHQLQYKIQENHLQFQSVDEQMKARDLLKYQFPDEDFALNLEKNTPPWLQSVSAEAMKLGLDLQGGIHFLLEVDTSQIEKNQNDSELQYVKDWLRGQKLRYTDIMQEASSFRIKLLNPNQASEVASALKNHFAQYKITLDSGEVLLTAITTSGDATKYAVEQTIHSLEKRINELGISEATIQRQGEKYISIDLPGVQDIVHAKKIIGKTATLRLQLVADESQPGMSSLPDSEGHMIPLQPKTILSGDSISFAHAKHNDAQPVVEIQLDGNAYDFYRATAENVGKRLAVIYSEIKNDESIEYIISAPVIRQALGDNFVIQGSHSLQEAKDLALLLRSGALAAPVKFIEETTIGPSLGSDNIMKGVISLGVGSLMIFLFMGYYYRIFGMIANVALLLNVLMIISILSLMGATLTLPGIAGIVLSVGMAVDANVLINERIREETHAGKGLKVAISSGYAKALSAIIDANVTTLLVTFVLFSLGVGAVKGFAITTCMGIVASIFTSVYFTQALTDLLVHFNILTKVNLRRDWFSSIPKIDFLKLSNGAFKFSAILLLSCILILPFKGLNLGLDFTGGQQFTIETDGSISSEDIRNKLETIGIEQAQVQTYGSSTSYMIKIGNPGNNVNKISELIVQHLPQAHVLQAEFIGPQVGESMLKSSLFAVAFALLATMAYVAIRFEYRFAFSAIISLIHDPVLILGIFSLFQIEFNLIALAAMLTILGYSINDTIVVYDRVRENFINSLELDTKAVINDAINQTLSRTVLTSCLTLSVVLALFFFGGDYLSGFSLSLAIGIIIGTYSSIYIAGSFAVLLGLKRDDLLPQAETGEFA